MNELTTMTAGAAVSQRRGALSFDLMDPESFNHIWKLAGMYAASPLFPAHLRAGTNEVARSNVVLVMNIAARMKEDVLTVAQNIYMVSGKPGWSASYMIAKANQHSTAFSKILLIGISRALATPWL